MKFLAFLLPSILSLTSCFEVNRLKQGDVVSGQQVNMFCNGGNSCKCLDGKTLLSERTKEFCVSEVSDCSLVTEDTSQKLHKIFTVENTLSDSYVMYINTNTSAPVCLPGKTPSVGPIFVRDYGIGMIWNAGWATVLRSKVIVGVADLEKVQLTFSKHWSGLFIKLYIKCGAQYQSCVAVKFDGTRSYPLTEDVITEIFPVFSSSSQMNIETSFISPAISSASVEKILTKIPNTTNTQAISFTEHVISSSQPPTTKDVSPSYYTEVKTTSTISTLPVLTTSFSSPSLTSSTQQARNGNTTETKILQPFQSTVVQSTSSVAITSTNQTAAPVLGTDDGDVTGMYVGISVAVFLFVVIIFFIWFCKRRQKKRKMKTNIKNQRYPPHASIRSLNSNSSSSSLTSPPAVLNKSSLGTISEKVENPLFKEDEHGTGTEGDQPSHVTVEKIRRGNNSSNTAYDNTGYSRNEYFGDVDYPNIVPEYAEINKNLPKFFFETEPDPTIHYLDIQKVGRHDLEPIIESPRSTIEEEDDDDFSDN